MRTTRYSPVAAHPERFCRPCPGRTDGKRLGEKINKSHVNLIELCESLGTQPCDGAVHSQSSLFVLLLRGSLAEAFLFFSLSSIGLKWAKVRMKPLKFTWSSLKKGERRPWLHWTRDREKGLAGRFEISDTKDSVWSSATAQITLLVISSVSTTVNAQTGCNLTPSVSRLCSQVFPQPTWRNQNTKKIICEAKETKSVWLTEST